LGLKIYDRYTIGGFIDEGSQSFIHKCNGSSQTGSEKKKLVIKISKNTSDLAKEIQTIKKISKIKESRDYLPSIENYGILLLSDFDDSNEETMIVAFYIMNRYETSLESII
jgi:hypothetical protein